MIPAPPNNIGHMAAPSRPHAADGANEQAHEGEDPPEDNRPIQDDFAALVTDAQANLDNLLVGENPDPVYVLRISHLDTLC